VQAPPFRAPGATRLPWAPSIEGPRESHHEGAGCRVFDRLARGCRGVTSGKSLGVEGLQSRPAATLGSRILGGALRGSAQS
jgi:hypothetical protein